MGGKQSKVGNVSTVEFLVKVWEGNRDFLEVPHESTGTGSFLRDMRVMQTYRLYLMVKNTSSPSLSNHGQIVFLRAWCFISNDHQIFLTLINITSRHLFCLWLSGSLAGAPLTHEAITAEHGKYLCSTWPPVSRAHCLSLFPVTATLFQSTLKRFCFD